MEQTIEELVKLKKERQQNLAKLKKEGRAHPGLGCPVSLRAGHGIKKYHDPQTVKKNALLGGHRAGVPCNPATRDRISVQMYYGKGKMYVLGKGEKKRKEKD
jgi:hypothetical protein